MSEKGGNVPKRFFIQSTEDVFWRLKALAARLREPGVEALAGKLVEEAVARKESELAKPKPRSK